jgi:nucleoside-diphosphate-sugar epimerase
LVTGASGFLGSRLTGRLCREGAEVHAVSRSSREQPEGDGPRWWAADLTQYAVVEELFAAVRPDVVFHFAGHVTAVPDIDMVVSTFQSLTESTVYLLTAATRARCERLVLAGSLVEPATGEAGWTPGSPYVAAKYAASAYGRMFQELYHAPVVVAHLAYSYGPGQGTRKLIPHVIAALLRGEAPRLTSGLLRADWIYVDDVIEGLLTAATADQALGRVVDLGSGTLVSVREVVSHLARLTGAAVEPQFGALPDRPQEQFRAAAAAETWGLIGWRATTALEEGLHDTLNWYRAQGYETCQQ